LTSEIKIDMMLFRDPVTALAGLALMPVLASAAVGVRDLGQTVTLGNASYYLPGKPEVGYLHQRGVQIESAL
jgi:hypothetical protein